MCLTTRAITSNFFRFWRVTFFFIFFFLSRFCTDRLQRLRKSLRFQYGKKKFTYHELTPEVVKNERFLFLALMNAERCWASHLDLMRQAQQDGEENLRARQHALRRLKKAAKWAAQLVQLCEVFPFCCLQIFVFERCFQQDSRG